MGHGQTSLEGLGFPVSVSRGKGGGMPLKFLPSVPTHFRGAALFSLAEYLAYNFFPW